MVGTFHYFLISSLHIIFWRASVTARHIILLYYTDLVHTPSRGYKNKILSNRSSDRILCYIMLYIALGTVTAPTTWHFSPSHFKVHCAQYLQHNIIYLSTTYIKLARRGVSNFQDCDWWRAYFFLSWNLFKTDRLIRYVSSKINAPRNN